MHYVTPHTSDEWLAEVPCRDMSRGITGNFVNYKSLLWPNIGVILAALQWCHIRAWIPGSGRVVKKLLR